MMNKYVYASLEAFGLSKDYLSVDRLSGGHINQTFKLTYSNACYVLQVVNSSVFSSVEDVMDNIYVACEYLNSKGVDTLQYLPTTDGKYYTVTSNGEYVRVCHYIRNSVSYESSNSLDIIYSAGLSYGKFDSTLSLLDSSLIKETIPNFHDTKLYFDRLSNAIEHSTDVKKLVQIEPLLEYIHLNYSICNVIKEMSKQPIHNDTKFSNVLFDKDNHFKSCIIDLDTIMNGYIYYDYADSIRSMCRTNDSLLDINKLLAYSKGFFKYAKLPKDLDLLLNCIVAVSLELACRYLFEYINGSNYFHLNSSMENYVKADDYIKFVKNVLSKKDDILKVLAVQ